MTNGDKIRAARRKAGLTQKDLASRMNISYQSIAQWENNIRNPKIETRIRIADALNMAYEDIFFEPTPARGMPLARDISSHVVPNWEKINAEIDEQCIAETGKTYKELEREYWEEMLFSEDYLRIKHFLDLLNASGKKKAIERVQELTEIPKYQAKKKQ